jgi:hypothetical protein
MSALLPTYLSRRARTECGATPAPHLTGSSTFHSGTLHSGAASRGRLVVFVIVFITGIGTVLGLALAGGDPAGAVATVAAAGLLAVEIATRLLGPPPPTGSTTFSPSSAA